MSVYFTDTDGSQTLLSPTQYTLYLTPAAVGAIWGIGGTVTYPKTGPAMTNGQSITIIRNVPITQLFSFNNQGTILLNVVEQALDTLCLEIQQIAAKTGQVSGIWAPNVQYSYGSLVQDGPNGNNSGNYYFTTIGNTSSDWSTALANGYYTLAFPNPNVSPPGSSTDKAIVRWNGTTGKIIQNSPVLIQDDGTITGFRNAIVSETGTSFTLSEATHGSRTTQTTNGSAVTVTCPNSIAAGVDGEVVQQGAGQVTFTAQSGATIQNRQSQFKVAGQYGVVRWKVMTNSDGNSAVYSIAGDTSV